MDKSALDAGLLAAHERGDHAELVRLYLKASQGAQDDAASAFYLTHAYVFALEAGLAEATDIRAQLVAYGAEPDP